MTELVHVQVGDSAGFVAEIDRALLPGDAVVLASVPGKATVQLAQSLETGLTTIVPAVRQVVAALKACQPDAMTVQFGIKLGGETGVILAKGTAEVAFNVTVQWDADTDQASR